MAALASSSMQLGKSMFQGAAVQSRPVSQPRLAAAAIMPIRASQSLQGVVVSTNGDKTAVVSVNNPVVHPIYKKSVKMTKKYICHVEQQQCAVGDIVTLAPSRPLSKSKRFAVSAIVKKGIN